MEGMKGEKWNDGGLAKVEERRDSDGSADILVRANDDLTATCGQDVRAPIPSPAPATIGGRAVPAFCHSVESSLRPLTGGLPLFRIFSDKLRLFSGNVAKNFGYLRLYTRVPAFLRLKIFMRDFGSWQTVTDRLLVEGVGLRHHSSSFEAACLFNGN